jgi:hypothetical protein
MPLAVAASSSRGGNLRCVDAISPWLKEIETTDTRVARPAMEVLPAHSLG